MSDALHALLEVQDLDTTGDQIRHRRETLPLRAELSSVLGQQAALTGRLEEQRAALSALAKRQSELEQAVNDGASRIEAIEKRMYGAQGAAARDLQAMADEVAHIRQRDSRLEDGIIEIMEEREPVEAAVADLEAQLTEVAARATQIEAALATADEELAGEERANADARAARAAAVPADLLDRYARLRQRLGGVGVARMADGRCTGCHLNLPATELDRMRKAPPDALVTCEQCGRILVRP